MAVTEVDRSKNSMSIRTSDMNESRGEASYFVSGVRPERLKPEAQRVDSGGGVLGDGEASLLPTS